MARLEKDLRKIIERTSELWRRKTAERERKMNHVWSEFILH